MPSPRAATRSPTQRGEHLQPGRCFLAHRGRPHRLRHYGAHQIKKKPGTAFTHGCFRLKERIHLFCLDFTRTHVCRFFSLQIMDKIRLISFLHSVAESCTRPGLRGVGICNLEPLVFHNLSLMCIDLLSRRPGFDLFSEVWSTSVAALAAPSLPFSPSFNPVIYTRPLQSTGSY